VIYSLAPSFKTKHAVGGHRRRSGLDHARPWQELEEHHAAQELTPWSKVTQISASHFDDNTAYVSVSRFRIDDFASVYLSARTTAAQPGIDRAGLPDGSPVDTVREDPLRKGLLFAGRKRRLGFVSMTASHWQSLQYNLPHTSMRDLLIKDNDLIVATHGRSFWILDDISPLRQTAELKPDAGAFLFKPGAAYRVRRSTYTDTPLPRRAAGENPPDGAAIDYALPDGTTGPVTLEVLATAAARSYGYAGELQRSPDGRRQNRQRSLTVKMDPRVKISPLELDKKLQAELRVTTIMSETSQALAEAESIRKADRRADCAGQGRNAERFSRISKRSWRQWSAGLEDL
jgi:hypothetical protein